MPLEVRLEWLDRTDYREYQEFLVRVTLQNTGRASITLPWEPQRDQVVGDAVAPVMECLISLGINDPDGGRAAFPIALLYGSRLTPGSLHVFRAGETAEILARGTWRFLTAESRKRAEAIFPKTIPVMAWISFLTVINGHVYTDLVSSNRLPIRLELPSER